MVCKLPSLDLQCTKNKTWKDIAANLGIGASSSGAYTLKKHYGKNLLPFECQFDRGGIDPGPLLQQTEPASAKKKKQPPAQPPPAPSPGSQDSRDSSFGQNSESGGGRPLGPAGRAAPVRGAAGRLPAGLPQQRRAVPPSGPERLSRGRRAAQAAGTALFR